MKRYLMRATGILLVILGLAILFGADGPDIPMPHYPHHADLTDVSGGLGRLQTTLVRLITGGTFLLSGVILYCAGAIIEHLRRRDG